LIVGQPPQAHEREDRTWRYFVVSFLSVLLGGIAVVYLFVLLVDPYAVIPFSLPIERPLVSISQRHMYPLIVRSRLFDSLVVGTSTSRLLDPELLDKKFGYRFANLAIDSATAWEQTMVLDYFRRKAGPPKAIIVGLDAAWCDQNADRARVTFRGFPDWLYDDKPWNDYFNLFNSGTLEIAGRLVGYHWGLYPERVRRDGYEVVYVDVVDRERRHGVSNYGMWDRLWIGILDLAGVWWLIRRKRRVPQVTEVESDAR